MEWKDSYVTYDDDIVVSGLVHKVSIVCNSSKYTCKA